MNGDIYDLIIVGGGPAGLTAGLYASRGMLKTLLLERGATGGQAAGTDAIENYPGFPDGVNGPELMEMFHKQAERFGMEMKLEGATGISAEGKLRLVQVGEKEYRARALIIAAGSDPNKLHVSGESELVGKGVSYCATCDAPFFRDAEVMVVGGGNSALDEGLFLTRFASKVIVVHRRDQLRADKIYQEKAFANPKMDFIWDTVIEEIVGEDMVRAAKLKNVKTGDVEEQPIEGVFIFIGTTPNTAFLEGTLKLDERGYIVTNERLETSMRGVWAAGDVQDSVYRQVVTSAGQGCAAALEVEKYLSEQD
jgi:thioredoxin reductase (NADPH)